MIPLPPSLPAQSQDDVLVRAVVKEMTDLRWRPRAWARELRELRPHMEGTLWKLPGRVPLRTEEGVAALDEAIAFLEVQKPLGALRWNDGLARVARELAQDQAQSGAVGHKDRKGRSLMARLNAQGDLNGTAGEAIAYGAKEAHDIVLTLLIDDGVPDRGHRATLFDPAFHQAGAATAAHPEWGTVCVVEFADGFVALKP